MSSFADGYQIDNEIWIITRNNGFVLQIPGSLMLVDAGEELGVKNLILYHTEEKTLDNRKENYTREAAENFKGRIFVPDDLEVILLSDKH